MLRASAIILVCLCLLPAFLTAKNTFSSREPKDILDGYWIADSNNGCFEDDAILVFSGNVIYARLDRDNGLQPWANIIRKEQEKGRLYLDYHIIAEDNIGKYTLIDEGNKLFLESYYLKRGNGKFIEQTKSPKINKHFLKTCNNTTYYSNFVVNTGLKKFETSQNIENELEQVISQ